MCESVDSLDVARAFSCRVCKLHTNLIFWLIVQAASSISSEDVAPHGQDGAALAAGPTFHGRAARAGGGGRRDALVRSQLHLRHHH